MSILEGIILGIVQGATEFLPVSSSGHLIVARELLGQNTALGLAEDAVLQLATVLAVMVYFRHDLWRLLLGALTLLKSSACALFMRLCEPQRSNLGSGLLRCGSRGRKMPLAADEALPDRYLSRETRTELFALALGTVPAIGAGLLLENTMETLFRNALLVAVVLAAGSLLFVAAEYTARRIAARPNALSALTVRRGVAIGLFQCLALVPGMSRSGATIAGGLFMGLSRERAARFSFLLSVPIILGSGLKKLAELGAGGALSADWLALALGAVAAFATGITVIHFLLRYLRHHSLMVFVWYRLLLAAAIVLFVA